MYLTVYCQEGMNQSVDWLDHLLNQQLLVSANHMLGIMLGADVLVVKTTAIFGIWKGEQTPNE